MKKLVSTSGMDKSEWLNYRKKGIGGSDAGAVCGFNPYRTAMEVYQDKTGKKTEEMDNEAMRQGREFEDYVARRFTEATGKRSDVPMPCTMMKTIHLCWQMLTEWSLAKMQDWNVRLPALTLQINGRTGKYQCITSCSAITICPL